jgi:hypothetical protein
MSPENYEIVGKVAGIAGIITISATILFRDIIKKNIFSNMTADQAYKIFSRLIFIISFLTISGFATYLASTYLSTPKETPAVIEIVNNTAIIEKMPLIDVITFGIETDSDGFPRPD